MYTQVRIANLQASDCVYSSVHSRMATLTPGGKVD